MDKHSKDIFEEQQIVPDEESARVHSKSRTASHINVMRLTSGKDQKIKASDNMPEGGERIQAVAHMKFQAESDQSLISPTLKSNLNQKRISDISLLPESPSISPRLIPGRKISGQPMNAHQQIK